MRSRHERHPLCFSIDGMSGARAVMRAGVSVMLAATFHFLVSCSGVGADGRPVQLVPVVVDTANPDRRQFGALTLLSAFELKSTDRRFGGISGLVVGRNGRLDAVSDRGHWLAARMVLGPGGVLQDLVDWEIKPLLAPDRSAVQAPLGDAEALAAGLDGSLIVGFEQRSRIWRYPPPPANLASPPVSIQIPPELAEAPKNGGIEALTVLPDGRILVLTEEFENPDGTFKGWLVDGGGRFDALSYQPSDGYHVTDCAALASGDLLVLERRYGIFGDLRSRLKLVPRERIRPGARLTGDELLRLEPPLLTENFEGLAVHENAASGATIYLVSDNNFLPFQRTLLLQFSLPRAR